MFQRTPKNDSLLDAIFYWPFFRKTTFFLMMINFCGPPSSLPFSPKGKRTAEGGGIIATSPLLQNHRKEQPFFSNQTLSSDTCEPRELIPV